MGLSRAWRIATVPLILAVGAQAQTLRPMTSVRVTTASGRQTVRVISADSASIVVENPGGARRAIARADITSIEHRAGNAKRGATILGGVGAFVGAGFGALLVGALCETDDCSDDMLPAMAVVGGFFGGIGAVGGAAIWHYAGGWDSMAPDVRVQETDPVLTCLSRPRIETQFLKGNAAASSTRRRWNVGAVCGRGTVVGVEFGHVGSGEAIESREGTDPQFGAVVTQNGTSEKVDYRGVYLEQPLTTGRLRLSAIGAYGEYRTEMRWFESHYMPDYRQNTDYSAFYKAYPYTQGSRSIVERDASVGVKISLGLGTQWTAGFATRLQRAGANNQGIESGITLSFRP